MPHYYQLYIDSILIDFVPNNKIYLYYNNEPLIGLPADKARIRVWPVNNTIF